MPDPSEKPESSRSAAPVSGGERISSLDVLRGVAIFGILVMNIYAFAMPYPAAYNNPNLMGGTDALNMGIWFVTRILVDQKFLTIFTMLFGAGIILMTDRAHQRGAKFGRIFYRRQFWLMVIGALHGYLIFGGDVLFSYAVIGMFVYLFRKRTPRALVLIACGFLAVAFLLSYATGTQMQFLKSVVIDANATVAAGGEISVEQQQAVDAWEKNQAFIQPNADNVQADVDVYLGSYTDIVAHRVPQVLELQTIALLFFLLWRIAPVMLIGMALMKTGVLTAERAASFYRNMMLVCYAIGLPLAIFSAYDLYLHDFDGLYAYQVGNISHLTAATIVGLGHVGLIMFMLKSGLLHKLLQRFAAVGRMALTNYLVHSLLLTTIFYGYGLGLIGSVSRIQQMGVVAVVITIQLIYSSWWLARYRFGPAEWLWRSLTYWQRQPMKRDESA